MTTITPPYVLPELRPFRTLAHRIRLVGGATVTENGELASDDYIAGVRGWCVFGNGDVEFNDGVFRGDIIADSLRTSATLLQSWDFTGGVSGWTGVDATLSTAAGVLVMTRTGAFTDPGAVSPTTLAVEAGRVYGVFLDGEQYDDGTSFANEALRFYSAGAVDLGTGDWQQHGEVAPTNPALSVGRATIARAPVGAVTARVELSGSNMTVQQADNVAVYELGTVSGATLDTRPFDGAAGVRIGTRLDFLGNPALVGSPTTLGPGEHNPGLTEPWSGQGLVAYSGSAAVNASRIDLLSSASDSDIALVSTRLFAGSGGVLHLYLEPNLTIDVLGQWIAWTPAKTGMTFGTSSWEGAYLRLGKTVFFNFAITFAAGFAVAVAPVSIELPFTPRQRGIAPSIYGDTSALTTRVGSITWAAGDPTATLLSDTGFVGTASPFTWAAGDTINLAGTYEAS